MKKTVAALAALAVIGLFLGFVEEVNKMELKELQLPAPSATQAQARP